MTTQQFEDWLIWGKTKMPPLVEVPLITVFPDVPASEEK